MRLKSISHQANGLDSGVRSRGSGVTFGAVADYNTALNMLLAEFVENNPLAQIQLLDVDAIMTNVFENQSAFGLDSALFDRRCECHHNRTRTKHVGINERGVSGPVEVTETGTRIGVAKVFASNSRTLLGIVSQELISATS